MVEKLPLDAAMKMLMRRYQAEPEALIAVLCPLLVPIHSLDKTIFVTDGQAHARASFTVRLSDENVGVLVRGRTGKFVPASYGGGDPGCREIAKGRIIEVNYESGFAEGEVYLGFGGDEKELQTVIEELTEKDLLSSSTAPRPKRSAA
jgi:hypothetical protein